MTTNKVVLISNPRLIISPTALVGGNLKISIFGTGYVGLVTGVCFSEMGNEVICVDIDQKKIVQLQDGISPIFEPGLQELLHENIKTDRIHFTTDAKQAIVSSDFIFIAVGTPSNENGSSDLKYVLKVAETIAENLDRYKVIVTKSTVPFGTNYQIKELIQKILTKRGEKIEFDICSNPEFLREGSAIQDCLKMDRIIIGIETPRAEEMMKRLYEPFLKVGTPIVIMDPVSSEMTKYAANAMLATKISLMNEFSRLCEKVGADIEHVRRGIGTDHRIGPHSIYAGLGYGGSCFPKDIKALIRMGNENSEPLDILEAVNEVNQLQRRKFFQKIKNRFPNMSGLHFAFWGAAFRPGTDDIREAPSLFLIENFLREGATVVVYDPVASEHVKRYFTMPEFVDAQIIALAKTGVSFVDDQYVCLKNADALIIPTEWKSFKEPDFKKIKNKLKSPVIFDGRNIYSPKWIREQGFEYTCIGRS